mgnify:CR=1 FL=1
MDIVGAFDLHRKQITFDYIEMESGEVHRGKIQPAGPQITITQGRAEHSSEVTVSDPTTKKSTTTTACG